MRSFTTASRVELLSFDPLLGHAAGLTNTVFPFKIEIMFSEDMDSLTEEHREKIIAEIIKRLNDFNREMVGAVLIAVHDPFLKNMVPPHNMGTLKSEVENSKFAFTRIMSPNPCRFNFPFFVVEEEEFKSDFPSLRKYLKSRVSSLRDMGYVFNFKTYYPVKEVEIEYLGSTS